MLKIKGFVNFPALTDNALNSVSKFGELSPLGRTFGRDPLAYTDSRWPDIEMVVLHSKDTATNNTLPVATEFTYKTLEVLQWIFTGGSSNPSNMTKNDFLVNLLNTFNGVIESLECGPIVTDGIRRLPEWISWKQTSTTDNIIKMWLVNEVFERDYDEYEIVIVPPLALVDTFFQSTINVKKALDLVTTVKTFENIHVAKNKKPETILRAEIIPYTNQTMNNTYMDTTWHAIIYGPAGDSTDNIKRAIIDYITANSGANVEQWKLVFPDIFRTTEMFVLPRWDLLAIQFRETVNGIYSPISRVSQDLDWAKAMLPFLSSVHVNNNLEVTHHKYRSVTLLVCGGVDNKEAKYRLSDYVKDYVGELTMTLDFNRQSESTKEWSTMMAELLVMAEEIDDVTVLPVNTRRTTRNDIIYVGRRLNGVDWLVASKKSIAP